MEEAICTPSTSPSSRVVAFASSTTASPYTSPSTASDNWRFTTIPSISPDTSQCTRAWRFCPGDSDLFLGVCAPPHPAHPRPTDHLRRAPSPRRILFFCYSGMKLLFLPFARLAPTTVLEPGFEALSSSPPTLVGVASVSAAVQSACCWSWFFLSRAKRALEGPLCDRFALYARLFHGLCRMLEEHATHCRRRTEPF